MRIELMVREQHHLAISRLGQDLFQPLDLLVVDVVVAICDVEADQRPVLVLEGEIAALLAELRQRLVEISIAAGIHLVV